MKYAVKGFSNDPVTYHRAPEFREQIFREAFWR